MMTSLAVMIPVSILVMACMGAVRVADKQCPHLRAAKKANKKRPQAPTADVLEEKRNNTVHQL